MMDRRARYRRVMILAFAGLAGGALATACGDDPVSPSPPPPPEPARPASIAVEPSSATLTSLGETAVFRATVKDQRGAAFPGTVTWSSSDETVFTVDAGGRATAVANGSGTVTATLQSLSATAAVEVAQEAASLETVSGDGQAARPGAVLPEPVVVRAVDAGASPVEGVTVVFAAGEGHGTADPAEAVTDTAGLARTVWTLGDAAGAQTLAASVADGPSAEIAARGLTAVEIVHDIEVVSGAGQTADLGAALDDSVVVRAVDAEGAPVEGAAVVFTPGEGHGTVDPAEAVTDSEGFARTAWTLGKTVGEQTLVAAAGDVSETILAHTVNPDRAALIALYEATDGPNWTNNENWLTDAPLGEWHGVETDVSGRVVGLDLLGRRDGQNLTGNGLLGPIPPELGNLAELEQLGLTGNSLTGVIPPELGRLAKLRTLAFYGNRLQGTIPPELGNLAKLTALSLGRNRLEGTIPPELGNLTELTNLDLRGNQLQGTIPPELGNLTELTVLRLEENELEGAIPSQLGRLASLSMLDLYLNNLTGPIPPELGNLASLRILNLGNNQLTGPIPPWLADLTQLWFLSLNSNQLTGPIPPELGNLTDLATLTLGGNLLTGRVPPELGNLVNLKRLTLSANSLTGPIPPSFLGLDKLLSLGCGRTEGVCLPATAEFREWLQNVELRGRGNFPVDILLCDEVDKRALAALYESANGADWTRSDGWPEDEDLDRWHGVTTGSDGRVSGLDLTGNGLSGRLPETLGQLTSLTELRIGDNALTGRLPLSLANTPMDVLDYSGTSLCVADDPGYGTWLNGIAHIAGTSVPCPPLTEREILETVYGSTDGGNWTEREGWLTGAPLEEWYGVDTDRAGRVVALRLENNRLSGTVPVELGQLSALMTLDLRNNRLHERIPSELGGLEDLRVLDLSRNQLGGAIPDALGELRKLEYLDLSMNQLSGPLPPALGDLPVLQSLTLSRNRLSGRIPQELGNLENLVNLHLDWNRLSGSIPSAIGNGLASLESLSLSNNRLAGEIPMELAERQFLRRLAASNNRLSGRIPPQFGTLDGLEYLSLSKNELTGPIPPELGATAQNLIHLDLAENQITGPLPAGLGHARRLQVLDVRSNELSGPIPPEYSRLTDLKSLIVAENPELSGPLPAGITALGQLERLLAGNTGLCLPMDPPFDDWFAGIPSRRLTPCLDGPAVYLTQAVQSWNDPVPLMEGERALLRVFVTAPQGGSVTMPDVKATFYVNGVERYAVRIDADNGPLPVNVVEDDLSRSANAEIPGEVIEPGLQMVVEVDPDGTLDPALGVTGRIPDSGRLDVDVRSMPRFDLTLVPFLGQGEDSSVVKLIDEIATDPRGHQSFSDVRTLLPIGDLAITAHAPVYATDPSPFRLLAQVEAMRLLEGGSRYWMGLFTLQLHTAEGIRFGWPGGVAYIRGRASVSLARPSYVAHELGHNMGLSHAPCGDAPGSDPLFPSAAGRTGSWGYDFGRTALVAPTAYDLMSYCADPYWISGYHFNKALDHRLSVDAQMAAAVAGPRRTLLVWGGKDAVGIPYLDPAFVVDAVPSLPPAGTDYTIEGTTADGTPLFSYSFDMPATADAEGEAASFVFALPVQAGWADDLANITLSGPGGSVTLHDGTDRPMAILRDPRTGQVRGFLSDVPVEDFARMAAARATATTPPLEVLISRGIPDAEAWRR